MAYFVKREDPENPGQFIYDEVSDSELEIPADVLKKKVFDHPEYKKVKGEALDRKEKLRQAKARQEELLSGDETDEDEDTDVSQTSASVGKKPASTPVPLDEEALFAKFTARLRKQQEDEAAAALAARTALETLAEKHGLFGEDAIELLESAKDPEAMAKRLAKSQYRYDDQIGGAPSKPDKDALQANIMKNLGLDGE